MGSHLLLSFLTASLLFLLLPSSSDAQPPLYTWCDFANSGNYTANSTFENNLNALLANLSTSAPLSSGFLSSTSGSIPERAYGLALCRGDANHSSCRSCLRLASENLPQSCPYDKNAISWYDNCLLRYANIRFAGSADYGNRVFLKNVENISSSDAAQFNGSVLGVLRGLQSYAVTKAKRPRLFAAGEMDIGGLGGFDKLYGLVQCTRDIAAADCDTCLSEILKDLPSCCPNAIGGRVLAASCNFRYEVYPFFQWPRSIVFPKWGSPPPA